MTQVNFLGYKPPLFALTIVLVMLFVLLFEINVVTLLMVSFVVVLVFSKPNKSSSLEFSIFSGIFF